MVQNHDGKSSFFLAVEKENWEIITDIFAEFKLDAVTQRDALGENLLFVCARNGNEKIFKYFMGSNEYFIARGQQNYKGRTVEHIVCMSKRHAIVDEIDPRPDTPDYYGSLPFFYTLQQDDLPMLQKQFHGGRQYFEMRNYKYETIFHIAGKNNALESLKFIIGKNVFIEHMLKRDFEGNTPLHSAAEAGSTETLRWMCQHLTKGFLEMQNDFGFTPKQAASEKAYLYNEQLNMGTAKLPVDKVKKYREKFNKCTECVNMLNDFEDFVTQERWNEQFNCSLNMYLDNQASVNMRIFMGMAKAKDLQIKNANKKRQVKPDSQADLGEQSNVKDEEANQA